MTIILDNNTYKYETEATIKLFIPAERFEFIYDQTDAPGDIIITRMKKCKSYVYFYSYIRAAGRKARRAGKVSAADFSEKDGEFQICRLLFTMLCDFYGFTPKWGLLTGIRPVRKINLLFKEGYTEKDIRREFSEKYYVSDAKTDIALRTAAIQQPIIPDFSKKTVSIYVSVPFCPTRCSYCSFVSHSMDSAVKLIPQYIEKLCCELEILGDIVKKYGLRNSQLLTIPPTGSISTMLGISGGIEPMFNLSYFRKTESLHNEDVIYKVYTPIVKEYMDINEISKEEDLGDIFVTAMNLKPEERIKMQKAWQKNIDASISSTINLPYEATVEDVYNIYVSAWENN